MQLFIKFLLKKNPINISTCLLLSDILMVLSYHQPCWKFCRNTFICFYKLGEKQEKGKAFFNLYLSMLTYLSWLT